MFVNKPQDMMKEYRKASVNAELAMADPYTITKALFQGVFERLGQAKGAIARGDLEEKAKRLASASAIIQHLKDTLDPSQAPEIAKNLAFIYDFMLAKIADASMQVIRSLNRLLRKLRPRCVLTKSTSSTITTQLRT